VIWSNCWCANFNAHYIAKCVVSNQIFGSIFNYFLILCSLCFKSGKIPICNLFLVLNNNKKKVFIKVAKITPFCFCFHFFFKKKNNINEAYETTVTL
jgi:hypothetical protein